MEAAGPIAGETCVVSTRAYVFHHNPQQGKWDPLGDRSRSLSRVQLLKRRHSNQSTFRLLARLENAPAHAPVCLQCVFMSDVGVVDFLVSSSRSFRRTWICTVTCKQQTRRFISCSLAMTKSTASSSARKQTQRFSPRT